ncbi:putative epidermal cell surface receptor isoform X3 [Schistocerca americana]|uniref:putative epidermal cell surface receptor isoform X3 n=1 Tax=Schistocerca americana TaxID=7009 RepID=UPI001F501FD0|nr:putative epidermal cell surface receptor isoform X3 [Schistocerca americana]
MSRAAALLLQLLLGCAALATTGVMAQALVPGVLPAETPPPSPPSTPPPLTPPPSQSTSPDASPSDSMTTTTTTSAVTTTTAGAIASSTEAPTSRDPGAGRALGAGAGVNMSDASAANMTTSLQDLSLDDIDTSMLTTTVTATATAVGECPPGGGNFSRGCEETCECAPGSSTPSCRPRCAGPMFRRGRARLAADPLCDEKPVDDCCAVLVCQDSAVEPLEICQYENITLQRGEVYKNGCEEVCTCGEAGKLNCKPRCPSPVHRESAVTDKCVMLPDPTDPCCKVLRCDVTLTEGDYETSSVSAQDSTSANLPMNTTTPVTTNFTGTCQYKGNNYEINEEFHDGCEAFCICEATGVQCAPIQCPTEFGLDLIDPHCLEWDTSAFVPSPPSCCPSEAICKNNGSCLYEGQRFDNFAQIPTNLTGCEQHCACEFGNVTCRRVCEPLGDSPPPEFNCPVPPIIGLLPHDNCCRSWLCPQPSTGFGIDNLPPGFPRLPSQKTGDITVHIVEAVDPTSVRLVFSVPPVLVGLHGRIELRYTSDKGNNDVASWEQQILAPPDDIIATPQLEFVLGELQPDTEYQIQISVMMRDIQNAPHSPVISVRTPPALPPIIEIDPALAVVELNGTWVDLSWRRFSEEEAQFIDGIQLRYKEVNDKVYTATPLIHRSVTKYRLENLRPSSQYEIAIFFIPFHGQTTELQAREGLLVSTTALHDPYFFELKVDVSQLKATSVEIQWDGVPYPPDKYVNVFRAIYQSDAGKEDFSTFKIVKRDAPPKAIIQDLKPGTRYRLWLEAYLTNGKIKKSNVKDFMTKPASVAPEGNSIQGKLEGAPVTPVQTANSYYSPLVAVAILAAISTLAAVILLLVLLRKHGQNKAAISAGRKSQSAYDNPSYKTCDSTGPTTNGNSVTRSEAP